MSRIGRKVLPLPKGVTLSQKPGLVSVKGPKGELSKAVPAGVNPRVGVAKRRHSTPMRCTRIRSRGQPSAARASFQQLLIGRNRSPLSNKGR